MLEVEYKAAVDDLARVEDRLVALGAVKTTEQTEEDTYFAHPMRSFQATDEALRIRTVTTAGAETQRVLTYKGPRQDGPTRVREEVEVVFDGDLMRLFEALSFRYAGRVRKHRTLYHLDGLTITLDKVEGLGDHVEIEALAGDTDAVEHVRSSVLRLVEALGLGPEERRSYLEMVLERKTG